MFCDQKNNVHDTDISYLKLEIPVPRCPTFASANPDPTNLDPINLDPINLDPINPDPSNVDPTNFWFV
jgi:hypothetical protein